MKTSQHNHQQSWRSAHARNRAIDLSGYASAQQRRYLRQLNNKPTAAQEHR